ncbi:unnamed protein product [Hydatigera taeniaeformis]|uniref:Uncharacterized protein n=1 Tax=Hydatigena taeniaeformis TaxID=6205 RepID=A0A0R3WV58_HYDTA|nr:unnamed protein product [Hydatigera taeniaeformis]
MGGCVETPAWNEFSKYQSNEHMVSRRVVSTAGSGDWCGVVQCSAVQCGEVQCVVCGGGGIIMVWVNVRCGERKGRRMHLRFRCGWELGEKERMHLHQFERMRRSGGGGGGVGGGGGERGDAASE